MGDNKEKPISTDPNKTTMQSQGRPTGEASQKDRV